MCVAGCRLLGSRAGCRFIVCLAALTGRPPGCRTRPRGRAVAALRRAHRTILTTGQVLVQPHPLPSAVGSRGGGEEGLGVTRFPLVQRREEQPAGQDTVSARPGRQDALSAARFLSGKRGLDSPGSSVLQRLLGEVPLTSFFPSWPLGLHLPRPHRKKELPSPRGQGAWGGHRELCCSRREHCLPHRTLALGTVTLLLSVGQREATQKGVSTLGNRQSTLLDRQGWGGGGTLEGFPPPPLTAGHCRVCARSQTHAGSGPCVHLS